MYRIFKVNLSIGEPLCVLKRYFSITNTAFTWNPVRYSQNLDVGRQTFQAYAVNTLLDQYHDLSASDINRVANGLTYENHIQLKLAENSNDILAKIGELKRKQDESALTEILEEVKKSCLSTLSSQDIVNLIKCQHPRFLLRHFCDSANINVYTSSIRQDDGCYFTSVFFEKEVITTAKHEIKEEAERIACLSIVKNKFLDQFNNINLDDFDEIPLERDVDIGQEHKQRLVKIVKLCDEDFGFTIRGGQQKVIKNKQYVQLNIITPILISNVKEGSPAQACGLRTGDVLLGVNDHALTNKTHEQAVIALKKFVKNEEVSLTVFYNKHELLKYEAEQKILEREMAKVTQEIKMKNFGKWHDSKSKIDPKEYFLEQFVEKKRQYRHKKGGNVNRLWHQYK